MERRATLRFLWWNVQSFSHYEETRAGESQWPLVPAEYLAKRAAISRVLTRLLRSGKPDLMAFAEVTNQAALDLQHALFPEFEVGSLDTLPRPELQVAFLFRCETNFQPQPPLVAPRMPRGTRPMAVVDYIAPGLRIRFIACHWAARFSPQSEYNRAEVARYLNAEVFRFLNQAADQEERHVVIVGDFNEEPFGVLEDRLFASRDRARSRSVPHYSDKDMERVRLYNCGWRLLGEQVPHTGETAKREVAGTYYREDTRTWHSFDQVIVSGGLLSGDPPFLDEGKLRIAAGASVLGSEQTPRKFSWNNGRPHGVSDHLPLLGQIVLSRENADDYV